MRRAFTLIEVLIVVAIMAMMVSVAAVSVRSGQDAARVKGAARDLMAAIRHARSMALVMMQPTVITYSTKRIDGEICAQVSVEGAKLLSASSSDTVETLSGEIVRRDGSPVDGQAAAKPGEEAEESAIGDKGGESMEEILFAPVSDDVVKGVRIKVTMGDELLRTEEEEERKTNRISVFSNVDYLLGKYKEKKAEEKKTEEESAADAPPAGKDEDQEPVSLVWEANGRCDPHRVWVYLDGKKPESGLCIKVDRFGAAKILSGEEED
jgi:prepilin-type N-terminal cleavage/methylation domain-containing protein